MTVKRKAASALNRRKAHRAKPPANIRSVATALVVRVPKVIVARVQTVARVRKAISPPVLIVHLVPREIVAHAPTVVRALRPRKPVRSARGRQRVDALKFRKFNVPGFTAGNLANVGRNRAGRGVHRCQSCAIRVKS